MLNYVSTRDDSVKVSSAEAVLNGLAPDGGLYVPDNLEEIRLDYKEVIAMLEEYVQHSLTQIG